MTIEEKLKSMLIENGMFEDQADAVIERVKVDEGRPMAERWNDDVEGYLPSFMVARWFATKRIALAYIEETCPLAWFKPMFED